MKKISFLLSLIIVLFLTAPTFAADVEFSGTSYFVFDEFVETDGKQWYSMNGNTNIFGTGDWKKSTSDNMNDNRETFQNEMLLDMTANVNQNLKIDMGFESLIDEFTGYPNGTEETRVQEAPTVRDNSPIRLEELTVTADTELAEIEVTNSFNHNFNPRILATQFEDNDGDRNPYGEGLLLKTDLYGVKTKGFLFQATAIDDDDDSSDDDDIIVDNDDRAISADKLIYGAQFNKDLNKGEIGGLVVNTHDKDSETNYDGYGNTKDGFEKDKDILRAAVNGKYIVNNMLTVSGEVITAQYGDDVENVINAHNEPSASRTIDVGNKEDTEIVDVEAKTYPMPGLEVNLGYKDVGEDYVAVIGADQDKDSWLGDKSFDAVDGTGYDKGFSLETNYQMPIMLNPTATLELSDYDQTRTGYDTNEQDYNDNEDTNEQEIEAGIETEQGSWSAEASYRIKEETNSGSGTVDEKDIVYNDLNINGKYKLIDSENLTTKLNGDLNYYVGDDEAIDQNFSTEKRIKLGTGNTYELNDKINLKGSYNFGYATEDNDVFENANGRQHLIKLGASYKISQDTTFDVMYKYDNYNLDRAVTADELEDSVYKKEDDHHWYDGGESWQHGPEEDQWDSEWPYIKDVAPDYTGYTTHEIKATLTVDF
ncbi:MAG: hypothetical protein ACQEP9_02685 [Bacillota bacterium]